MMKRAGKLLAVAVAAWAFAGTGTASAADPSVDEMIEALTTKPAQLTPRTRSLARPGTPPPKREGKLQLSIQFEYNSAKISPESRELLLKLASAMKSPALAGQRYRIEGHTDITGSVTGNQRLSERRALAVTDYLKGASGIEPARFTAWGLGSSTLANPADPKAAENRRVVIISMEPLPAEAVGQDTSASVQQVKGDFTLRRKNVKVPAQQGTRLQEGDVISTSAGSSVLIKLDDGANLLTRGDTEVKFTRLKLIGEPDTFGQALELLGGAIRYVSGSLGKSRPNFVSIRTNAATIGIRGTDFDVVHSVDPIAGQDPGTYVKVNTGAVSVGGTDGSSVQIGRDQQAYAGKPKATRGMGKSPSAIRVQDAGVFKKDDLDELLEQK